MRVKKQLEQLGVRPQKGRGQNFVIQPDVIRSIVDFGDPRPEDTLVEIGPGLGALTEALARCPRLTVIEIEERFCAELRKRFPGIRIINDDVRNVELGELGENIVVFGNLPYAFSTEIVFHLLRFSGALARAVLLLQKEFAQRMAAAPGSRTYGSLSVACQLSAELRLGPLIAGDSFHPPAAVESQVVELTFLKPARVTGEARLWLERVVQAAFSQRRKKIVNSLKASRIADGDIIERALDRSGIDPSRRAETVSVDEYIVLASQLRT